MENIKKFLQTKQAKTALWTVLNSIMALIVTFITYEATGGSQWAISVLPIAQAASQFVTKYLNK